MSLKEVNQKIEDAVVGGYKKIEEGVVGGYKKVEQGFVDGYKKVEDKFVDKFFTKDGETTEEAKERMQTEQRDAIQKGINSINNVGPKF